MYRLSTDQALATGRKGPTVRHRRLAGVLAAGLGLLVAGQAAADSAAEININVTDALKRFRSEVGGGSQFLAQARGVLVFPKVYKAGFGIGGEYGEGALLVGGKTVAYYSTAAASFGLQLGAQRKSILIVFMTDSALAKFRASEGWKVGVDGSVALVKLGAGGSIDTENIKDPVVGFIFGNEGLMYNLTLEGSKITRLKK